MSPGRVGAAVVGTAVSTTCVGERAVGDGLVGGGAVGLGVAVGAAAALHPYPSARSGGPVAHRACGWKAITSIGKIRKW
eukprot:1195927-Prorocentrum_minimum.AAC.1